MPPCLCGVGTLATAAARPTGHPADGLWPTTAAGYADDDTRDREVGKGRFSLGSIGGSRCPTQQRESSSLVTRQFPNGPKVFLRELPCALMRLALSSMLSDSADRKERE